MKKLLLIIATLVINFFIVAELNYLAAVQDAQNSEGTDSAIEDAMKAHGFIIDAMDNAPVSAAEKLTALFSN